jgi:hypothetical protein
MAIIWGRNRTVTETTQPGRPNVRRHRPQGTLLQRRGRLLLTLTFIIGALGGYILGYEVANRDLQDAKQLIQQLQTESQKLKKQVITLGAAQININTELARVQARLHAITPAKDVYNIYPNQSLNVAEGRLTIGMVGSPTNETVTININGKQYSAVSGDVINIARDPSTACQVEVQSFDMFKAALHATCAPAKPR